MLVSKETLVAYLLIYDLFNNAFSSSDYVVLNTGCYMLPVFSNLQGKIVQSQIRKQYSFKCLLVQQ